MRRHIITGAPGAGKTTILNALRDRGHPVVREAVTDLITREQRTGRAEPWTGPGFIDAIVRLQRRRQQRTPEAIFDRSPVCTLALARYLDVPVTPTLTDELDRIAAGRLYDTRVFFVRLPGFMTNTAVRRITLEQAERFEIVHERAYREYGYELIEVPPGPLADRTGTVEHHLR